VENFETIFLIKKSNILRRYREVSMNTRTAKNRWRMFAGCFLMCLAAGAGSMAVARGGPGFHGNSFHGNGFHRGAYYGGYHGGGFHGGGYHGYGWSRGFHRTHFWGGFYIGPEWFWGPTIVVAGIPYYYYSGLYYTPSGDALVAVTPPITAATAAPTVTPAPSAASEDTPAPANTPAKVEPKATQPSGEAFTINVPDASGGFTPVKLVKVDKGYVGPQGEFYKDHPTVAELKVLYGK
jgi:hypothetical protein